MKKVFSTAKLSTPSKFVRKVLSRSSDTYKSNDNVGDVATTSTTSKISKTSTGSSSVGETELTSLREQMSILQLAVNSMHEDAEQKDKVLSDLEKEKSELRAHLKREKRSSTSLQKQLQDERAFYYKEKEHYCQEMNDCKKLKKKLSETLTNKQEVDTVSELLECKSRMATLQNSLNETLEANYNLSVKFMKMKNTKTFIKKRLKQHDLEHKKTMERLMSQVNDIKDDLAEVVDDRFTLPVSPSNKKYLHVIKQNGVLMYEKLCLQMQIEDLHKQIDDFKLAQFNKESKSKFKSLRKDITTQTDLQSREEHSKVKHRTLRTKNKQSQEDKTAITKIFEKTAKPGIPNIIMLPEDLPGIEFREIKLETNFEEPKILKMNVQSVSQFSPMVHCSSTQSILRTQSSPDVIMSSMFVVKHKS